MNRKHSVLNRIILGSALVVVLAIANGCTNDDSTDHMRSMSDDEHERMQSK